MEPIRGPLDYHRYPPKLKRSPQQLSASMSSSDPTPHQPRYRSTALPHNAPAQSGRASSGESERILRRPHERQAEVEKMTLSPEHASLDSEAFNDWLEGRHRGPSARRRARRGTHATSRSAAGASGDIAKGKHSPQRAAHADDEAAPPARSQKSRHLRSLWERNRKAEKPALKRFRTPFWKIARRITFCLLVIGAGELVMAALTTPRLAIQNVEITGAKVTPLDSLQPIAQELMGQNWIRVRTQNAALAAAHLPSVKEAHIERVLSLPPMKLALHITERQPFARVGAGATWWIVDRDGIPFRQATKDDEKLHAVTSPALHPEQVRLGTPLPEKAWKPFVVLADALEHDMKSGGQWQLRRTYLDKFGFASLRLTGGSNDELLVRLGGGQWPQKLQRARQALDYFAATGRRAAALNLVSYNMPTWTPRTAATDADSSPDGASTNPSQDGDSSTPVKPSDKAVSDKTFDSAGPDTPEVADPGA